LVGIIKDQIMTDKIALCDKIKEIYPDIGACGIDVTVDDDREKKVWVVDLKKDRHRLKTYLEPEDADVCMDGRQCIGLGLQIAQLRANIKEA